MVQQRTTATDTIAGDIFTSMQEALVFADLEGVIRAWNGGAEILFGFGADEAIGQSVDLIVPEKMRRAHWDGFNKAVAHGDILSARGARITRALQKNGEALYVEMSFAMVYDAAGVMTGSVAVARDATARYLADRAARQTASTAALPTSDPGAGPAVS